MEVDTVRPLDRAGSRDLGLVADARYLEAASGSDAGALLTSEELASHLGDDPRPRIVVADAHAALVPLLARLDPTPRYAPGVHPTAVLERGVHLGEGVSVGPWAVLETGAVIGDRTRVGAHCTIGRGASIGPDGYLHPGVVVYANTRIGARCVLHAGCRIGSDGFGFAFEGGRYLKIPHVGRAVLGDDVEVGANACVDRGSIGDTEVGDGVKIDNLVHLAHNVRVGAHSVFAAQVGIAGSTKIGAYGRFGGQAGAVGHLEFPDGFAVAAASKIFQSPDEGVDTFMGHPARDQRETARKWAAEQRLPDLLRRVRALERRIEELVGDGSGGEGA
jgi:UDP-3-O-[3-hydroxymyristoyl] glucosamine N-acyltransferase